MLHFPILSVRFSAIELNGQRACPGMNRLHRIPETHKDHLIPQTWKSEPDTPNKQCWNFVQTLQNYLWGVWGCRCENLTKTVAPGTNEFTDIRGQVLQLAVFESEAGRKSFQPKNWRKMRTLREVCLACREMRLLWSTQLICIFVFLPYLALLLCSGLLTIII